MSKRITQKHVNQRGFTIIELMISTVVFSTVLVVLTSGVIYFTNTYYKGITLSTTQNTVRQITEDVSRAIQFGGSKGPIISGSGGVEALCIGNKRYTYVLNKQVKDIPAAGQVYHALVVDKVSTCDAPIGQFDQKNVIGSSVATTQELIGNRMRLVDFSIMPTSGASNLYQITVSVAYGDDDLFTKQSDGTPNYRQCLGGKGSHFCGTATLVTSVQKRV